jgi:hypothetical protein
MQVRLSRFGDVRFRRFAVSTALQASKRNGTEIRARPAIAHPGFPGNIDKPKRSYQMKFARHLTHAAIAAAFALPGISVAGDLTVSEVQGRSSSQHATASRILVRANADVDQAGRGQGAYSLAATRLQPGSASVTASGRTIYHGGRG